MKDSYKEICDILKMDERFLSSEGALLKNKIIEYANKMDERLISLLYKNEFTKNMFFAIVGEIAVFDKVKFNWVIESEDFLPDSYTKFKNSIVLVDENRRSIKNSGDVVLEFPYKDCVLEMDSTSDKEMREEVFLNETIMKSDIDVLLEPKCFCNATKHKLDEEGKLIGKTTTNFNEAENLIINGNNLLVLHSLLPRYKGKIKLMYWDILYNTQSDYVPYNDSFKHSSWLTMMKNRLEIAHNLLDDHGTFCVQINDDEKDYLKILMDEIFDRKNYIATISVKTKSPSGFQSVNPGVFKTAEYIMMYAKNKANWEYNLIYAETTYDKNYKWYIPNKDKDYTEWQIVDLFDFVAKQSGYENAREARIKFGEIGFNQIAGKFALDNADSVFRYTAIGDSAGKDVKTLKTQSSQNKGVIYQLKRNNHYDVYIQNGQELAFYSKKIQEIDGKRVPSMQLTNIWNDIAYEGIAKEGNSTLKRGKKPEKLIKRVIDLCTNEGDIVLDAYLGSGTTAAVAHKMGRRYIGVEQLISHYSMAKQRLLNVIEGDSTGISKNVGWNGGGSFISCRLANDSHSLIDNICTTVHHENLNALYRTLKTSQFALYRLDTEKMDKNEDEFKKLSLSEKKKLLISIIDKNTLYINFSDIDDWHYDMLDEDKEFTKSFYRMED